MPNKRRAKAFVLLALAAMTLPAMAAQTTSTDNRGRLLDRIVAVVNDDVILLSELQRQVVLTRRRMQRRGAPRVPDKALRRQVLDEMISVQLQVQRAKRMGIRVPDNEITRALSRIARQNGFTLNEMPKKLAAQGIEYSQFREHIRKQMTLRRVRKRAVENKVFVAPSEVDEYLVSQARQGKGNKEYHVYQILLSVPPNASDQRMADARAKAETIHEKIKNGANFQSIAMRVSDGPKALKGGNLGWLGGGALPTSLGHTVLTMDVGAVSEPIQDAQGWHILKLADERAKDKIIVTQTHARHILIQPDLLVSDKEAREKLETLRQKIKAGADFAKLAKEYSDDTNSAAQGGDLGWLNPGMVVPEFQKIMDNLGKGDISRPFQTAFGWHIVQVLDRRKKNQTEKTRRRRAMQAIRQRKMREKSIRWRRKLRDEAYVRTQLNNGDGNASAG